MPSNAYYAAQVLALANTWKDSFDPGPPMDDEVFAGQAAAIVAAMAHDRCNPPGGWNVQVTNLEYGVQFLELAITWKGTFDPGPAMSDPEFIAAASAILGTAANERCDPHGGSL